MVILRVASNMFAKVFVVCVLAFAVNALENVDIPNTFGKKIKLLISNFEFDFIGFRPYDEIWTI